MDISKTGIDLIKSFESLQLHAYKAVKTEKYYTIGYGHYDAAIKPTDVITEAKAEELLKNDLKKFVSAVNALKLKVNQNQFDALVSFCFNVGAANLRSSTLVRKAKVNPDDPTIYKEFLRWNKSGGKVLRGLTNRRMAEANLYIKK